MEFEDYELGLESSDGFENFLNLNYNDDNMGLDSDISEEELKTIGLGKTKYINGTEVSNEMYDEFLNPEISGNIGHDTILFMSNQLSEEAAQLSQNAAYNIKELEQIENHTQQLIDQGISLVGEEAYFQTSEYLGLESSEKKANIFKRIFAAIGAAFKRLGQAFMMKIVAIGNLIKGAAIKGQVKYWEANKAQIIKVWGENGKLAQISSRGYVASKGPIVSVNKYMELLNNFQSVMVKLGAICENGITVMTPDSVNEAKGKALRKNILDKIGNLVNALSIGMSKTSSEINKQIKKFGLQKPKNAEETIQQFGKISSMLVGRKLIATFFTNTTVDNEATTRAKRSVISAFGPKGTVGKDIVSNQETFNKLKVALKSAVKMTSKSVAVNKKIAVKVEKCIIIAEKTSDKKTANLKTKTCNETVKLLQAISRTTGTLATCGTLVMAEYLDMRRSFISACKAVMAGDKKKAKK